MTGSQSPAWTLVYRTPNLEEAVARTEKTPKAQRADQTWSQETVRARLPPSITRGPRPPCCETSGRREGCASFINYQEQRSLFKTLWVHGSEPSDYSACLFLSVWIKHHRFAQKEGHKASSPHLWYPEWQERVCHQGWPPDDSPCGEGTHLTAFPFFSPGTSICANVMGNILIRMLTCLHFSGDVGEAVVFA